MNSPPPSRRPHSGTDIASLSALKSFRLDMQGAATRFSAWSVTVFDQASTAPLPHFSVSNVIGTFGAGGAAAADALSAVRM